MKPSDLPNNSGRLMKTMIMFYKLSLVLLDADNHCSIYDVRPKGRDIHINRIKQHH